MWWSAEQETFCAVPAPPDTNLEVAKRLPGQVGGWTAADLLELCRERYGWDDTCETCDVLARDCGHRQPERERGD